VPALNRALYIYQGDTVSVAGRKIENYHSVQLRSEEATDIVAGKAAVSMLLLQGRPINEPVVQHGPFVMNTPEEISMAFAEYRKTQFGGWPWPSDEHVHPGKEDVLPCILMVVQEDKSLGSLGISRHPHSVALCHYEPNNKSQTGQMTSSRDGRSGP
jgi:hypothetical protein